jgi:hypothetical protein
MSRVDRRSDFSSGKPLPSSIPEPPVPQPGDPTVLVNGKPVVPSQQVEKKSASGASKEAAAAKAAEQKFSGKVQEAKVRSLFEETSKDSNVVVNSKKAFRTDDHKKNCEDQNTTKEKK